MNSEEKFNRVIVVGNTSWGTTLANQFANRAFEVVVLTRNEKEAIEINQKHCNESYLPGVTLKQNVVASNDWSSINGEDLIVIAVPSISLHECLSKIKTLNVNNLQVLCATKGLENKTGLRMSEVIENEIEIKFSAAISGPNLSAEINKALPSATVVASINHQFVTKIQNTLHSDKFRVYTSDDLIGVELGGALKNIIAIAAGIVDAFQYGDNAKSGVVTRGLAEISRLAVAAGGNEFTLQGLSGIGDLIATSYSEHSRNRKFGELIGKGYDASDALSKLNGVCEGYATLPSALLLAQKYNVELPIFNALSSIINDGVDPEDAVFNLMSRDPR
tara:strand:+ start:24526 stop:25524 length:999 start_codon:yes stop_codon:yes gene_type:complete